MSSRELLALVEEFPETSTFKEARDRTFRLVERDGKLGLFTGDGKLPQGAQVIARYVDWTDERKMAGRAVQELAAMRADGRGYQPDFTGLREPLTEILLERKRKQEAEIRARVHESIRSELYAYEKR
ncbi:hypothetical protein E2F47_01930 [Mycobacterium eburneum]|nr:hypothetical protein [Mycobacterium eburneum]TDH57551.1 hypothetical protein E2F47_01930 [Mycobacterium eburneum]